MSEQDKAKELIKKLYNTDCGSVGGYGHIVFDDGNIDNNSIEWCIKSAKENKYKDSTSEETRLASLVALEYFLQLTEYKREQVYNSL